MPRRILLLLLIGCLALAAAVILTRRRTPVAPAAGIPQSLAESRAARISDLRYDVTLNVPAEKDQPIPAKLVASFTLRDAGDAIAFDFAQPAAKLRSVTANGSALALQHENGHVMIPSRHLEEGANTIAFEFDAGEEPLNRGDEVLYALFVPARASQTMPVFDQPDLKARWKLTLNVPSGWEAVSNGRDVSRTRGAHDTVTFEETQPISTYLFSFAAGRFSVDQAERGGRTFRMLHRENDAATLARNRDAIFDLHASAIAWLEDYTGIPYPFGKFDFVLIPSFQFGGMEHPGAVFYNASGLLLDESATQNQMLGRASLIAHETAHMWFGDLVTMKWFNDVWMKEVFANFMAAKIVNPSFPEVNHDLRFLYAHYPAAYDVDRTAGANPIRQDLANLNEAGSLYGAIIYQKAPIAMRELERLIGEDVMRDGLREYLRNHAYGNAAWPDLIAILDSRTPQDLVHWSRMWIETAGRPTVGPGPGAGGPPSFHTRYGDIVLRPDELEYLTTSLQTIADPLERGSALVVLWENMLEGRVPSARVVDALLAALPVESDELNVSQMLSYFRESFWRHTDPEGRVALAARAEPLLRSGLERAASTSARAAWFNTLRSIATTPETVAWLEEVWRRDAKVTGLPLAESDEADLALDLAVRDVPNAEEILRVQHDRLRNPDRKARFAFVAPAVSRNPAVRAAFFDSLRDAKHRRREAWVLEAARYLHHPLRAADSARFVRPALELVHEIQRTGDIFFPKRWADATLGGYQSAAAADEVRAFIDGLPADYPPRLKWVLLASADPLFRAAKNP